LSAIDWALLVEFTTIHGLHLSSPFAQLLMP
jgi:hypothetical protein